MKDTISKKLPKKIRRKIRDLQVKRMPTISKGWENYAKQHKTKSGEHLGDEWNEPEIMGIDSTPEKVVSYLDEKAFSPFLGKCDTLLEIGSGGGRFTEILLPKCKKLIAADTSPTMIKLLKKRFANSKKIEYLALDGLGLSDIADNSIDVAFTYGVFVHLQPWDIYNYIAEFQRVLKQGGKALVHVPNSFSELGWKRFLNDVPISVNRHKPMGTFVYMNPDIMKQFCQRAGLQMIECHTNIAKRDCICWIKKTNQNA